MNIALLGYGKMGKEIERLVNLSKAHVIVAGNKDDNHRLSSSDLKNADVAIDFTLPVAVIENIRLATKSKTNMVIGTTGWYEHLDEVKELVKENDVGLVYGQNFSIGANIFFQLVAHATKLTSAIGGYDTYGFEIHHAGKKDSPSGTALRTAEEILKNSNTKKKLVAAKLDRERAPEELHFSSVRGGRNPGFHQVVFDSNADSLTLAHSAHNREGFAQGAILAAEFIADKKGLYTFDDVIRAIAV